MAAKKQIKVIPPRGEATRQALIQAGLTLFGEYGFQGTSTRMLAQKAGANISAIPYYFEGKAGLYQAVVEYIAERFASHIEPSYHDIAQALENGTPSSAQAEQAINHLLSNLATLFVASDEPKSWALIIIREQMKPSTAFDCIYQGAMKRLHSTLSTLIAARVGLTADSQEAWIRAYTLIGQILIFLSGREAVLRGLGVRQFSSAQITLIYQILQAQVAACLNVPSLQPQGKS